VNVPSELIIRTKTPGHDTEDLAFSFVEEEVGRFDWRNNWPKIKESGTARQKIQDWLNALQVEHDPDEIILYLDRMLAERAGRWV
jgi:hypothetical protein